MGFWKKKFNYKFKFIEKGKCVRLVSYWIDSCEFCKMFDKDKHNKKNPSIEEKGAIPYTSL